MSTQTKQRTVIDQGTGEAMALVALDNASTFSMAQYLSGIISDDAVANQQALASAYDRLVQSLIGANDVHDAGDRTYKKKSAWLKLARAFQLDSRLVSERFVEVPVRGSLYEQDRLVTMCYVVVEVTAPWGQTAQAVGGCGYDEETPVVMKESKFKPGEMYEAKGKEISLADMIATAQTRATNRAISNLIALGEVTFDEVNHASKGVRGEAHNAERSSGPKSDVPSSGEVLGFGKHKARTWAEVAATDADYLAFLVKSEREKAPDARYRKSEAWVAFVESLINGAGATEEASTEAAGDGMPSTTTDAAAATPGQYAFAEQLSDASALTEQQRAWAKGKIAAARANTWDADTFSKFIKVLKGHVDTAEAAQRKSAGSVVSAEPIAPAAPPTSATTETDEEPDYETLPGSLPL